LRRPVQYDAREKRGGLLRVSRGRDIEVVRIPAEQEVAHAAPDTTRLRAGLKGERKEQSRHAPARREFPRSPLLSKEKRRLSIIFSEIGYIVNAAPRHAPGSGESSGALARRGKWDYNNGNPGK
jgi:hypothetical protein